MFLSHMSLHIRLSLVLMLAKRAKKGTYCRMGQHVFHEITPTLKPTHLEEEITRTLCDNLQRYTQMAFPSSVSFCDSSEQKAI